MSARVYNRQMHDGVVYSSKGCHPTTIVKETLKQTPRRGGLPVARSGQSIPTPNCVSTFAAAPYNLVLMRKLIPIPAQEFALRFQTLLIWLHLKSKEDPHG